MQFTIYNNLGNSSNYPYLVDVQSDLIDVLTTRLVIPLFPISKIRTPPPERLCPVIVVTGERFVVMTHEMASIRCNLLGKIAGNASSDRERIKNAIDFLIDGF
ncbi:CcdB family protein [Yersinia intermedia]|jgi:toxin CcdB|uniref:CcdB family protein n=1 Tax=Yersinia intermedia TaxID=631 RepID=UPI000B41CCBC|nr:CcdB family protein [Yersinia intermedia]MCW8113117.1 CcdB family protein [Yersinia intermedia]MDA5492202.1 CcdB family protein [Yersinia intermedia]MDA5517965.1 CcdB family protein [Yersinia intermedia]OVZ73638.1 cytotoxin [Yersinia intermedia]OWF91177.1 cytotoxin [Yersinia intermedia]